MIPIAKAGLSLGLTTALITSGVIDYDSLLNWESVSDMVNNMNIFNGKIVSVVVQLIFSNYIVNEVSNIFIVVIRWNIAT